ncbi:MAG: hypothetical protein ACRDJ3_03010 [Solirubrobacteraceae bacterium]
MSTRRLIGTGMSLENVVRNRIALAMVLSVCALLMVAVVSASPAHAAAPEHPVAEAQSHTATSAVLHGVLNPGIEPPQEGTYEFVYAASPTTCTGESKAHRGLSFGFPSEEVGEEIGSLTAHTTYTACLLHRNLAGEETLSTPVTFTTSFEPETPQTDAADAITTSTAMLHGELNPNPGDEEEPRFFEFIYKRSAGECEGEGSESTGQIPAEHNGVEKETGEHEITGLTPGTQYTYCVRAWNSTGQYATGTPVTFTTSPEAPSVSGETSSNVGTHSVNVSAQIATGGLPVTSTVQYGATNSYGQETSPLELGPETTAIGAELTGLQPGVEYHYRFHVSNTQGEQDGADATFTTTSVGETTSNSGGTCPNEQLRAENNSSLLPECRAYEQVTPVYKGGYPMLGSPTDGEKVFLVSLATLGSSEGAGQHPFRGAEFVDKRTPTGWQASSINPPESQYVGQLIQTVEPVSGLSLWAQHTPQEPATKQEMYVRSAGPNPQYSSVGPLNIPQVGESQEPSNQIEGIGEPGMRAIAGTADFEHVLTTNSGSHWPFDSTQSERQSLYEYSGSGNAQPILVGVTGSEKGSTQLIGRCGTVLGSGKFASLWNAQSSDGSRVFFTVFSESVCGLSAPVTNEVYARSHGALTDPAPAVTTDVSESECTVSCGEVSGKRFEGASEDGERVFFTSTQKLTDDGVDTTGGGDASVGFGCTKSGEKVGVCNLYEYDFGRPGAQCQGEHKCLRLVAGGDVLGVAGIAEDGSRIYFVSRKAIVSAGVNEFNVAPQEGEPNLYGYDTQAARTVFVGTLSGQDQLDWSQEFTHRPMQLGGERGRYLLFESSQKGLTPDDTSSIIQLFEYDALTGELVRVTKGEDGYDEDGNGAREGVPYNALPSAKLGQIETYFHTSADLLNMSTDGHTVVFETGARLSPRAVSADAHSVEGEACTSVYVFHSAGPISAGAVHLVSDGRDTQGPSGSCGALFKGMDAAGANIMFETLDSLVPSDADGGQADTYDARVDGGFAASKAVAGCQGGGCLGSPGVAPSLAAPASVGFNGVGNLVSSPTSSRGVKSLSRAQKLARALQRCRREPRRKRRACERAAHRRYGRAAGRAQRMNGRGK